MPTNPTTQILDTIRTLVDELERILEANQAANADLPTFDPDTDVPPVTPKVEGSRIERDWCGLMLWAKLRALNMREQRGATPTESVAIAKAAGYQDGRAWNQWTGWTKDDDGNRWVADQPGMTHLRNYYKAVGRTIPEDIA